MHKKNGLMTIGEIADAVGITRRMIINYEDKGLISPDLKEGETGYRFYTIDTLTRIRTIRMFQDMGLTLDEIWCYLEGTADLATVLKRLEDIREKIDLNIEKIRERMRTSPHASNIEFAVVSKQTIYKRTERSQTVSERTTKLRDYALMAFHEYGTDLTKRMYFIEYPIDDPDLISFCAAVPFGSAGEYVVNLPKTECICIYHHGAYEDIPNVRQKLMDYAKENSIAIKGTCRHIYLEGPPQHKDPDKFITQIALPIGGNNPIDMAHTDLRLPS